MAKKEFYLNSELTYAEKTVLAFLEENKGTAYTNNEIEQFTGIQVTYINSIVHNLRLKGYKITTDRRNRHEYEANSMASYLLLSLICIVIVFIFISAGLNYLDEPAAVYEIDRIIN